MLFNTIYYIKFNNVMFIVKLNSQYLGQVAIQVAQTRHWFFQLLIAYINEFITTVYSLL